MVDLTENITILGTEKGLYSYYEKNLVHIEGLEELHHVAVMSTIISVIMIVDKNQKLVMCDLNHVINTMQCAQCTKPRLKYGFKHGLSAFFNSYDCRFTEIKVNDLEGFTTIQVSPYPNQLKVCIATSKQLVILDYDMENNQFVPIRILDTAEPMGCALFTENSLIVGANKFFEIDLVSFEAEEFLDVSDVRLKQAQR